MWGSNSRPKRWGTEHYDDNRHQCPQGIALLYAGHKLLGAHMERLSAEWAKIRFYRVVARKKNANGIHVSDCNSGNINSRKDCQTTESICVAEVRRTAGSMRCGSIKIDYRNVSHKHKRFLLVQTENGRCARDTAARKANTIKSKCRIWTKQPSFLYHYWRRRSGRYRNKAIERLHNVEKSPEDLEACRVGDSNEAEQSLRQRCNTDSRQVKSSKRWIWPPERTKIYDR